ncbi:DUF2971 domain-containing protein [Marinomonas primoryensis]|nr:DUF2971 domain-containing protein [Marinomonas primoryensis]
MDNANSTLLTSIGIPMLYHYTSLEGLLGILNSQSIWASHCEFLNDSSEFHHALSFAKNHSAKIYMGDDYLSAFGWGMRHALERMNKQDIYVSSFSEKPDLLSQWRGYCPQGAGICIGFDKKLIEKYCSEKGYKLSRCLYDHEEQRNHISEMVKSCLQKFPEAKVSRADYDNLDSKGQVNHVIDYQRYALEGQGKPEADAALSEFCNYINECAPIMKDYGFHEEAEWRVVARNPIDEIYHRTAHSHLVPYIKIPVIKHDVNTIKKIIVGPNPSARRCISSIRSLLKSHSLEEVEIANSSIPFSSW